MLSPMEMRVLDQNARFLGVATEELMEHAGGAVAGVIAHRYDVGGKNIQVFCGPGNNGGDGFVAARRLMDVGAIVEVILLTEKVKGPARRALETLSLPIHPFDETTKVKGLVVDAILGTGVRGDLRGKYRHAVSLINESKEPVISVDVPTGLGTHHAIRPDVTVTFHDVKEGMTPKNCGEIIVEDIGIPPEAQEFVGPGDLLHYPLPEKESHKGENGRLLVVGGGPYTGAPALVGMAAYRTGVDLVTIVTRPEIAQTVASFSPNLIVRGWTSTKEVIALAATNDAVVIGPGLGPSLGEQVREIVSKCERPMVIDADAIQAIDPLLLGGKSGVITPHVGEFEELTGARPPPDIGGREDVVGRWARKLGFTVLLKASTDVISDGETVKLNRIHNQGMTVGGTGDVLSGVIGALLAKGSTPFNAARMGAFINGYAGNLAFEERWYSLLATDVIEKIPAVLKTTLGPKA